MSYIKILQKALHGIEFLFGADDKKSLSKNLRLLFAIGGILFPIFSKYIDYKISKHSAWNSGYIANNKISKDIYFLLDSCGKYRCYANLIKLNKAENGKYYSAEFVSVYGFDENRNAILSILHLNDHNEIYDKRHTLSNSCYEYLVNGSGFIYLDDANFINSCHAERNLLEYIRVQVNKIAYKIFIAKDTQYLILLTGIKEHEFGCHACQNEIHLFIESITQKFESNYN